MILYHGSNEKVIYPEIRKTKYNKDFSWGFYCTSSYSQAKRWSKRKKGANIVNIYSYKPDKSLKVKIFNVVDKEWLDFIAVCRNGYIHEYDIVEGPMADDTVWNFVNEYMSRLINEEVFMAYAKFKHPTHQISFHSIRALNCLTFEGSEEID